MQQTNGSLWKQFSKYVTSGLNIGLKSLGAALEFWRAL